MRCNWPNLENNELYIKYHDNEWGVASYDDRYLFEMFVLESFHCGLSWLIILTKRENFRKAFDNFDYNKIALYDDTKVEELLNDKGIVRSISKIKATINNAICYKKVIEEYKTFSNYIWSFTNNKIISSTEVKNKNVLSDKVSKDLKKRGFKFMGTVTTYSYLEAIGVMNNHQKQCFKNTNK